MEIPRLFSFFYLVSLLVAVIEFLGRIFQILIPFLFFLFSNLYNQLYNFSNNNSMFKISKFVNL